MEQERPKPHYQEAYPCNQENCVVFMFDTVPDAFSGDVNKHCICERIYELCTVWNRSVAVSKHQKDSSIDSSPRFFYKNQMFLSPLSKQQYEREGRDTR